MCPQCLSLIPWKVIRADKSFRSENCKTILQIPRSHLHREMLCGLVAALILGYVVGVGGWWLVVFTAVAWFPMNFVASFFLYASYPPTPQFGDEYLTQLRSTDNGAPNGGESGERHRDDGERR